MEVKCRLAVRDYAAAVPLLVDHVAPSMVLRGTVRDLEELIARVKNVPEVHGKIKSNVRMWEIQVKQMRLSRSNGGSGGETFA